MKTYISCSIKNHTMKTHWACEGIATGILNLDIRWEWLASRPGRFTPGELTVPFWMRWRREKIQLLPLLRIEPLSSNPQPSLCIR